jgi:2,4-dienoyl-CoA reductase-like NADH-dependent reductase (Old Yellow Enzyme family)
VSSVSALFTPVTIKNLTLSNRIVMAPMTRAHSPGGVPGSDVAGYYQRRAESGVGLILTEGTAVAHLAAVSDPKVPRFHGEDALAGWARVLSAVHGAGGRIMPQLWHVGTMRKPGSLPNPEAPPVGTSMTQAEIDAVIEAYRESAANAKRLGFDGLEIHAAHGYLIDQFFWEGTNQRTDRYGGSVVERTRLACEVIEACRSVVGNDFPILFRFSQWKILDYNARLVSTPQLLADFLAPLADAGVDVFHCSTRRFWEPEFEGSHLNLAGWTKKLTGKPTITVGSVGLDNDFLTSFGQRQNAGVAGIDRLVQMIENQEADLVAVGRALLADPAWAAKIRDGRSSELTGFNVESLQVLT